MADVENEAGGPEAQEENEPVGAEETEAPEAETNAEEDTSQSPEAKESGEIVEPPQGETTDETPAEEGEAEEEKPEGEDGEGDKEAKEEAGEGEEPAEEGEGGDKPADEESAAAAAAGGEAAVESSDGVVDNVDAQPEAADADGVPGAAGEGEAAVDALTGEGQETAVDAPDGEVAEPAETGAPAEAAEGAEAESSDVPKDGEGEEVQEDGEKGPEDEAPAEDGETKPEGDEEGDAVRESKVEEPVAEDEDRAGSPVGERLSRGPTPETNLDDGEMEEHARPEATTPDKIEEEDEEGFFFEQQEDEQPGMGHDELEEEDVEPPFRREDLIEQYHEALADRELLQQQNYALQHKLAEYFRKKKADERQDYDKNVTDQEQRYLKYMAQLEDLRRQDMMEKDNFRAQIEDAKDRCQDKKEKVDFERKKFMEFKKQVALNSVNSRSGKPIPPKDIEQYLVYEVKKEQEVVNVRLENIKLKNKLKKKEQQLKSKEELAEGLHLIDFEQLKIENQTYNEKIEERNEELLKLRKKITSTVQVLTHLKEKLQFVQGENLEQNKSLKEVEASLAQSRDVLSRTKQARDALRIDNQKLRQNCGLLGNEPLLRDFEERKDEGDDLRTDLEQLRMRHAELTLHCNQVRRKIEQARQNIAS